MADLGSNSGPSDSNANPRGTPTQVITVTRREPPTLARRFLMPMLFLSVFLNLYLAQNRSLPQPTLLDEEYQSGPVGFGIPRIAIVEVTGAIDDANTHAILRQIRQASTDPSVRAMVLRIDSPGGTVTGSDQIWRELMTRWKPGKKPLIASLGGTAASGGYYIAAAADTIVAEPTTLTGSIGVILEIPQLGGLMEKVGVNFATITTGPWKDSGSMYRNMTDEEKKRWRVVVDDAYQRFIRIVAQGRRMTRKQAETLATGKVFTAEEAYLEKLVDQIGYLDDALRLAKIQASLESMQVIRYVKPFSVADLVPNLVGSSSNALDSAAKVLEDRLHRPGPRILLMTP